MSATSVTTAAAPATSRGQGPILGLLAFAQLIVALDYNIVYVALPEIASGLRFSDASLQWVVSAYAVAFGGFLLLGGRACDLFSRRRVFILGLVLYGAASLLGGVAVTPWMLITARAVQGLGGALLFPATLSLVNTTFAEGAERNRALSVWGAAGASGMILGSLAGGVLTQAFGWEAVFFVNVPLVGAAVWFARRLVPADNGTREARSFDLAGAVTVTLGTTLTVFALVQAPEVGWTAAGVVATAVVGLLLLAGFVIIERRTRDPLLPFRLLANRDLGTGVLVTFLFMATMGTMLYFLTVYFQTVHNYSAMTTGVAFLVPMSATCLGSMLAGRVATRLGMRRTIVAGLSGAASGAVLVGLAISPDGSYLALVPGLVVFGLGQGTTYTMMFAAAATGVASEDHGIASGMASTTQQVGGAVGLALLVAVANAGTAGRTGAALRVAVTDGLRTAVFVSALGILLTLVTALRFSRPGSPSCATA